MRKFSRTGASITASTFGTGPGTGDGQFDGPDGVAFATSGAHSGAVYVTDTNNNRIEVFALDAIPPTVPSTSQQMVTLMYPEML